MTKRDHVAIANCYMQDVLTGTIPTHDAFKRIVQGQVADLARAEANDPDFPYVFCRGLEMHSPEVGTTEKPIILEPWQCFMVTATAGWVPKEQKCQS